MANEFLRSHAGIWSRLIEIEPHSIIAPFGFNVPDWVKYRLPCINRLKIIMKDEQARTLTNLTDDLCEIKFLNRIHTKMAIGKDGLLFGSFNFTQSKQQEVMLFITDSDLITKANHEFQYFWDLAKTKGDILC